MASSGLSSRDKELPAPKDHRVSISFDEPTSTVGPPTAEHRKTEDSRSNFTLPQDVASNGADVDDRGLTLTLHTQRQVNRRKRRIQALEDAGLDGKKTQDVLAALDDCDEEGSLAEDVEEVRQETTQASSGAVEEPGSTGGDEEEESAGDEDDQEKIRMLAEKTHKADSPAKPHPEKENKPSSKPPPTEWETQVHEEGAKAHNNRLEADLRRSGLDEDEIASIMKRRAATDKTRPVYTKIARKYIAPDTLDRYGMPWEFFELDPNYIIVKRFLPQNEADFLFEHTRKIRQRQEKETRSQSQRIIRVQRNAPMKDVPLTEVAARSTEYTTYRRGRRSERKSSRFGFYPSKEGRGHSPGTSANFLSSDIKDNIHLRLERPQRHKLYAGQQPGVRPAPPMPPITNLFDELGFGMRATIVDFKPGRDPFIGKLRPFIKDLLEGPGPEALMAANYSRREASTLRWIHLPANNMSWVESLMSRVYSERPSIQPEPSSYKVIRQDLLLKHELWSGLQHRASNGQVHARFMRPFCSSISTNPTFSNILQTKTNIVVYLPYLNWEYSNHQQTISRIIADAKDLEDSNIDQDPPTIDRIATIDEKVMRLYLNKDPPLHVRRTLDQSYYYSLDNTDERDRDQVVYRHTRGMLGEDPLLMMVDQLWMWVIDGDTVVTCFPQRWGKPQYDGLKGDDDNVDDDDDVLELLLMKMSSPTFTVSCAYDIALAIIDQCCSVFYDREQAQRPELQFFEFFESAIGSVTQAQSKSFEDFWNILSGIRSLDVDGRYRYQQNVLDDEVGKLKMLHQRLGDINLEILLQKEIKDVLDELFMIQRIYGQQHAVVSAMAREMKTHPGEVNITLDASSDPSQIREPTNTGPIERGEELLRTIDSRSREITEMQNEAKKTYDALSDLLDLKQRQANVQEARSAREMAEDSAEQTKESIKQGRTIMVFTIVTIIFLPLSFIASVFGMNAKEINGGSQGSSIPLGIVFAYMFPISFVVTSFALTVAFSSTLRQKWTNATFIEDRRERSEPRIVLVSRHQNVVAKLFRSICYRIKIILYGLRGLEYPRVLDDSEDGSRDREPSPRGIKRHDREDREARGYSRKPRADSLDDQVWPGVDFDDNRTYPRGGYLGVRRADTGLRGNERRRSTFIR